MSYRYSRRAFLTGLTAFTIASALAACGSSQPATPTPVPTSVPSVTPVPTSAPTSAPTATVAATAVPTSAPTATVAATVVPTSAPTEVANPIFKSAHLPVQLLRPTGWNVADFGERDTSAADQSYVGLAEQSALLSDSVGDATCIVRYYNYKGVGSGDVTGAYVALQFNEGIDRETVSEHSNPDGSMDAEWKYLHPISKKPYRALVRFIHNENSAYTYAVMFAAPADQYDTVIDTGRQMLASFQENA